MATYRLENGQASPITGALEYEPHSIVSRYSIRDAEMGRHFAPRPEPHQGGGGFVVSVVNGNG
jgi:hypothetical protein